jgi:hypothetical protein
MTNRVSAIAYDHNWNEIKKEKFPFVEDAMEWCEAQAGGKLRWGDTQIGYEGVDEITDKSIDELGEYPLEGHPIYQIQGITDDDIETCEELEEEDHRSGEFQ